MKLLRIAIIFTFLLSIFLLNWNCTNDQINQSTISTSQNLDNKNNNKIGDFVDSRVQILVREYVKIENGFQISYEWRDVISFTCGEGVCFNPYAVLHDGFNTPVSPRTEGSNTITTQYFKIYDSYSWTNVTPVAYYAGWCLLFRNTPFTIYYSTLHPFGTTQGIYATESSNLDLPSNTYIQLDYGVTAQQDDK